MERNLNLHEIRSVVVKNSAEGESIFEGCCHIFHFHFFTIVAGDLFTPQQETLRTSCKHDDLTSPVITK